MKNMLKKITFINKVYYRLLYLFKSYGCKNFGYNSYVDSTVHILGLSNITIGKNSVVSADTWFNVNDRRPKMIGISIGNDCYIGKRNFLNSGKKIIIRDFFMSGINCSFLGCDHDFSDPRKPYIQSGIANEAIIDIGLNVWFGANVTVIGNVKIGHGVVVGANSLVNKDIPPFSIAIGNPAKVIKRFDFDTCKWTKEFSNLTHFIDEHEYKKILSENSGRAMPLLASGKNFGDLV